MYLGFLLISGWREACNSAILPPMEEPFSKKQPEYPWQLELPEWAPAAKMTKAERRADDARYMLEWEEINREEGWGGHPLLFHDEAKDLFRFSDGTFALSRERANWPVLKEKGFFRADLAFYALHITVAPPAGIDRRLLAVTSLRFGEYASVGPLI